MTDKHKETLVEAINVLEKTGYRRLADQLRDLPTVCPEGCDCSCDKPKKGRKPTS